MPLGLTAPIPVTTTRLRLMKTVTSRDSVATSPSNACGSLYDTNRELSTRGTNHLAIKLRFVPEANEQTPGHACSRIPIRHQLDPQSLVEEENRRGHAHLFQARARLRRRA